MTRVRFCWDASCRAGRSSVTHIPRLVFGLSDCPRPIRSKRTELWCRTLAVSPSECGSERRVCAAFMLDRRNPGNLLIASWPGSPPLFAAWPDDCVRSRSRPGTGVRLDKVDLFNRRASRTSDPSGPPATVGGRFQEKPPEAGVGKPPMGRGHPCRPHSRPESAARKLPLPPPPSFLTVLRSPVHGGPDSARK